MCLTEYNEAETMEMFKEEGREEGREESRVEWLAKGVRLAVDICKSQKLSSEYAIESVVKSMGISESEAKKLVMKYW